MTFSVKIAQWDHPVTVEIGQTILEAALAQGVPFPHGCRSGNCGACKSRLISGEVEMAPFSEYALSPDERATGLVLACRSVPWEAVEIAWLGEDETVLHPVRQMRGRVIARDVMTHDIHRLRIAIEAGGPFDFSPGQYCSLQFADLPARDYSMAGQPQDAVLEFHIRAIPGGTVSGFVAGALAVGTTLRMTGPYGAAWLREGHRGPILALAGGSGLAPVKSIVERALALGTGRDIHLYFGVRDARDLYLEDHFAALAAAHADFRFVPVLSAPGAPGHRRTGLVHHAVAEDFAAFDGFKAYLAGPPPMVEAASGLLTGRGMQPMDVHADAFYTEADKAALQTTAEGSA
jgi:NAD(P)H-flavin reductase/ferredoxin